MIRRTPFIVVRDFLQVARETLTGRGQLLAYLLIVIVAVSGFYTIQRNAEEQDKQSLDARRALCLLAQQQNASSVVLLQAIADLVVKSSPRSTPEEIRKADEAKRLVLEFQVNALSKLPTPDCVFIVGNLHESN